MEKQIEKCRQIALNTLKPTKKQLEHGLALHHDALVWDAYGFLPSAYPDDSCRELLQQGPCRDERIDFYEQYRQIGYLQKPELRANMLKILAAADVNCVFQNSGVESSSIPQLIKRLSRFTYLVDRYPEYFCRAPFPEQADAAQQAGKYAVCMSANAVPMPEPIPSTRQALYYLTVFFQLGIRMMHLTYNRRNLLGDGCGESSDGGLSSFGREVIAEMNRVGILADVSHCGQRTSLEAAECSAAPVVASHSAVLALGSHPRCKSDEVIKAIAKSGGYVGICTYPEFYRGSGKIDSFLDHIDYIAEHFGVDHVAIGTDRGAVCEPSPRPVPPFKTRPIFEKLKVPATPFEVTPEMTDSTAWTNWPLFTVGLVRRGYADRDIRKIIGGNIRRVLSRTLALSSGCAR